LELLKTPDGSFVDRDGKVIVFSPERFARDIGEGECCFICGAAPGTRPFNAEHVIPDWILKAHSLHSKGIELPNAALFSYGRYTIPCCEACNSLMSKELETPISRVIAAGYQAVSDYFHEHGPVLFFKWLALIFLKTHLCDRRLRTHLDKRKGDETLADRYDWEELHHVHCLARSFYTGARLDPSVLGTLVVLPSGNDRLSDGFDYGDNYLARTMLLQVKDVSFISVLNDSGISGQAMGPLLESIRGPLAPVQLREVMARVAYASLSIKMRPAFRSEISHNGQYVISADLPPKIEMEPVNPSFFGELFYSCAKSAIPDQQKDQLIPQIRSGKWTYIVDGSGKFIDHFKGPIDPSTAKT
jgi:hypothetical protein